MRGGARELRMTDAEIGGIDLAAIRPEERDEDQPEHVVRGDRRGDDADRATVDSGWPALERAVDDRHPY